MRGCGYESLRPLGSVSCKNAPSHLKVTTPQRTTRPRFCTAIRAALSRRYQYFLMLGCAARQSLWNCFISSSVNASENFRNTLTPPACPNARSHVLPTVLSGLSFVKVLFGLPNILHAVMQ